MTADELKYLIDNVGTEITRLKNLPKDDIKRIDAFFLDWKEATLQCKTIDDMQNMMNIPVVLLMIAADCTRKFTLFNWDPFKPFRFKADEIAIAMGFERYKKMRKL